MPDILIRGVEMPQNCVDCYDADLSTAIALFGAKCPFAHGIIDLGVYDLCHERHPDCPLLELPPHGELIETKDVLLALVEHGQRDKRFKLGDTIRYSPSEVKEIIDASVPVIVPAERSDTDA